MNKKDFKQLTSNKYIFLDGATGSNLTKAGMLPGCCPEKWIMDHPEALIKLQTAYVEAGTDILYAPTFTANRIKLAEYGLEDSLEEINQTLVALSRQAAQNASVERRIYVAGDITMTGRQLNPIGDMALESLIEIYKEQIRVLYEAGVDLLVIETMMSLAETRAALIAAKEVCDLPIMITLTFEKDGRTLFGSDAKSCAIVLESLGADAIGVNCSTGPKDMCPIIADIVSVTNIPVIAKPNAGMPMLDAEGNTVYTMAPDAFCGEMKLLADAGASILGGCCGTDPTYIKVLSDNFKEKRVPKLPRKPQGIRYLCSETSSLSFGLNDLFFIIGERINPTGKKKLQEALRNNDISMVLDFAEEQEAAGAKVLDVNVGMGGIDEKQIMLRVLEELPTVTGLPLSLDSSNIEVLEAALRHYPGRALVNSVSLEEEKFNRLLPLVKKYGAMFILLPLSDNGLPADIEEKKKIISKVSERAFSLGLTKEDIIVDGLVTTVGANKMAARETLETIRYCKEQGYATVCGLSNISFGMPERSFVNTAFVTLAIQAGLTTAIANPSQELLSGCAYASDLLLAKEDSDLRYIENAQILKEMREAKERRALAVTEKAASNTVLLQNDTSNTVKAELSEYPLYQAVLKGNRKGIAALTKDALEQGNAPKDLLDNYLLPAINQVGEYFDQGKYFLPQLIASAEAMKTSIEILEPLMLHSSGNTDMPTVIIATVEGDIHDIGKNLVALMLKNHGFRVIDLGKDVPKEEILSVARKENAQIIALSALMTTTMKRMKEIIDYAATEMPDCKVIVGGAVITEEYAKDIGAHGFASDAADAVKVAKRLCDNL